MKFATVSLLAGLAPLLTSACLLPEERAGLPRKQPSRLSRLRRQSNGVPVGTGDRFNGGAVAPRGLGSTSTTLTTLLNVNEILSGLKGLANAYNITTFTTPYTTYQGASIAGGRLGASNDAVHVYFNGQIHARERGSAEGLLYFIGDLLYANANNLGLKYGSKSYTNAQVKTALSAGIVFIPLSNPDGVAYDYSTNSCWRKNRNPASSTSSPGVDLNRNFDFVWDLNKWAPSVRNDVASSSPSSEVFHGKSVFSEPESKSIKWVLDTYSKVRWFIDLHSYTGDVLYSWGSDENQSKYPYMNFLNSSYDGVRGDLSDTPGTGNGYGEYTPDAENTANIAAAKRVGAAMSAAAGRTYSVIPAANLYPTSGATDDYSYSRHFADPTKNLVHGYTIEFGFGNSASSCPFYPTQAQHQKNIQEIGAGYLEFLLAAVELGLK